MLTHLIILLDDTSVSYCHYNSSSAERNLISLDGLKAGILFAMKENLNIQFVYPNYELPLEYDEAIESIDHTKIKSETYASDADVIVLLNWKECTADVVQGGTCIIKASKRELYDYKVQVKALLGQVNRLNIMLTDIEEFADSDIDDYKVWLDDIAETMVDLYRMGKNVQLNLLTDRLMLSEMNNCNAGVNNITLAPNGKFYLCPAFYYQNPKDSVGDLESGLKIRNRQLLKLDHAPICRNCDAYQCKRCVWMNSQLTLDINTPSHQQCVMAHLERNASRELLIKLEENGIILKNYQKIEELAELDPFNSVNKWK